MLVSLEKQCYNTAKDTNQRLENMRIDRIPNIKKADLSKLHSKKIILDREVSMFLSDFFGLESSSKSLQIIEDDDSYTFNVVRGNKPLIYIYDKQRLYDVLNEAVTNLSLGQMSSKLWLAMILILNETHFDDQEKHDDPRAFFNEKYRSGCFTSTQMRQLLGIPKGGKQNQAIKQAFASLTAASLSIQSTQRTGKLQIDTKEGFNFIDWFKIDEKKSNSGAVIETTYYYTLNRQALGISLSWIINGRLSGNQAKRGYLSVPISDLSQKRDIYYTNFLTRLRLYGGGEVSAKTVLTEWIKVGKSQLKERQLCKDLLQRMFKQAVNDKEIQSFQLKCNDDSRQWLNLWKTVIIK